MIEHLRPALALVGGLTLLTGVAYPLALTGIAQVAFPDAANGSLATLDGTVIGSRRIGQTFADPKWFNGRPSATSAADPNDASKTIDAPYNAANSSGSNLGPLSTKLVERVKGDVEALKPESAGAAVPADAVTTSGSGLDPDVSPAFARLQAKRVAASRGLPLEKVEALIAAHTRGRDLGILGEPRGDVLGLNLALARLPPS
ncbi:MAG: potassium-transporting ATPase subunit KdpC [Phyllobacteriaceae bacterium]|nr:potassium-transporting ATPase subunit KdpC [Phyllobacteriaceae bacterium]